jgi:uncharacterized protein YjaZ
MKIFFADSAYDVPAAFKNEYQSEVKAAYTAVTELLPFGSKHINFIIQPREYNLIAETNDNGHTHNSELIELAFNPKVDTKASKIILDDVKATIYHEMNHAARFNIPIFHRSFLDNCILDGLATVFERAFAGSNPPYGDYPDTVSEWVQEIITKNDMFAWASYSFNHPDGRRWIAYKVGTYIVDEAMRKSGKSIIELTQMECADILLLAEITVAGYSGLV